MLSVIERVQELAATSEFSGVVRIDVPSEPPFTQAFGLADRRHNIANRAETRFSIASGTKGLTALAVLSVIESGLFDLDTTARSVLDTELALIDDNVTIGHLLAHRSGIGDYIDESQLTDMNDYAVTVPVHQLASTEDCLTVLSDRPQVSPRGTRFAYNNSGFVVLALIVERTTGQSFDEVLHDRVCAPAGMVSTGFVRSDQMSSDEAIGYLDIDGLRTNALHLPVLGTGDGGIFSTAADIHALWSAVFDHRIVSAEYVRLMTKPHSDAPDNHARYGLGIWLHETSPAIKLMGSDAGISFRTMHHPVRGVTSIVMSNTSLGAWSISRAVDTELGL